MIVADTNLIAYLFIKGEFTHQAETIFKNDPDWVAPYLWRSEFRNILFLYLRKKIITTVEAKEIVLGAESLLKGKEFEIDSNSIIDLSAVCSLSAYDCEYVLLAQKLDTKLVTNDSKILKQFPQLTINLSRVA